MPTQAPWVPSELIAMGAFCGEVNWNLDQTSPELPYIRTFSTAGAVADLEACLGWRGYIKLKIGLQRCQLPPCDIIGHVEILCRITVIGIWTSLFFARQWPRGLNGTKANSAPWLVLHALGTRPTEAMNASVANCIKRTYPVAYTKRQDDAYVCKLHEMSAVDMRLASVSPLHHRSEGVHLLSFPQRPVRRSSWPFHSTDNFLGFSVQFVCRHYGQRMLISGNCMFHRQSI